MLSNHQKGQSLIEMIVVITVGLLVVGALTFTTLFSLRNAQFSKTSAQATKLSQEGVEKVRSIRDRDESVIFTTTNFVTSKFSDLWALKMSDSCNPCYFRLTAAGGLNEGTAATFENLGSGLERQVQISDDVNFGSEKNITVVTHWSDFAGIHESKLSTILRKI